MKIPLLTCNLRELRTDYNKHYTDHNKHVPKKFNNTNDLCDNLVASLYSQKKKKKKEEKTGAYLFTVTK